MSLATMLAGLVEAEVEFVVIGGVAAAVHASSILTNDLDICYRDSASNIRRLSDLLRGWKARRRDLPEGAEFTADPRTLKTTPTLNLRTTEGDLDVLAGVPGLDGYQTALKQSEEIHAFGTAFRVLTLPALITTKEAMGRAKDLAQLPVLRAVLEMRGEG